MGLSIIALALCLLGIVSLAVIAAIILYMRDRDNG